MLGGGTALYRIKSPTAPFQPNLEHGNARSFSRMTPKLPVVMYGESLSLSLVCEDMPTSK